jgi:hypothetical protein
VTVLPLASFAVTTTEKAVPAVDEAGADTTKWSSGATTTVPLLPVAVHVWKTAITEYVYDAAGTLVSEQLVLAIRLDWLEPQAALVTFVEVFVRVT